MTPRQIQTIHIFKSRAKLNDAAYRTLLRSVASVESSKDLSQAGYEDVMAVLEAQAEQAGVTNIGTYWRETVDRRGVFANPRQLWLVSKLYQDIQDAQGPDDTHYELAGLVHRVSRKRTSDLKLLNSHEAWKLTEMLKDILDRMSGPSATPASQAEPAPF